MRKRLINIVTVTLITTAMAVLACSQKSTAPKSTTVKRVKYLDKILQHQHPEKVLNYLPEVTDEQLAYLFGCSVEEYAAIKKRYDHQAKKAAEQLLATPDFAAMVNRLPFKANQKILCLGESTTDALDSWAVILQHLLNNQRPQDHITIVNAGISGQTTTEAYKKFTMTLQSFPSPDWIICFLGANDAMRYGPAPAKTTVSLDETLKNLDAMRRISSSLTQAKWVWMTPAPIHEKKIAKFPYFNQAQLSLVNADILPIGEYMLTQAEPTVDVRPGFGNPVGSEFVQVDGGHLTIEGQKVIVQSFVEKLSNLN